MALLGNICSIIAFTFLAPLPFVPTNTAISVMNICTAVQGIGVALTNVSAFTRAQMAAQRLGFNQDLKTYIMISGNSNSDCNQIKANDRGYTRNSLLLLYFLGLFASALFLGNFLGPTMAGFLVEEMDFPRASEVSLHSNLK